MKTIELALARMDEPAVLCVVAAAHGSVPRGAGAMMLISGQAAVGTIGGGAVEHAAQQQARQMLRDGSDKVICRDYDLSARDGAALGMVCGGGVTVAFLPLSAAMAPFWQSISAVSDHQLQLRIKTGTAPVLSAIDRQGAVLASTDSAAGPPTIWAARPEQMGDWLCIPMCHERAVLFGAGHVSQALVPLLHTVDFACTVIDNRAEFANGERFPEAESIVVDEPVRGLANLRVTSQDYLIIATRGHLSDYAVLAEALRTPARYIGMIGGRGKVAATRTRLMEQDGFTAADFARVHTPIGLPIGAQTPAEVAVSIAAQLIAVRYAVSQTASL